MKLTRDISGGFYWEDNNGECTEEMVNTLAWMPLPEPYKEEEE